MIPKKTWSHWSTALSVMRLGVEAHHQADRQDQADGQSEVKIFE